MFRFPFTNFHELNLDWILSVVKEAKEVFDNGRTDIDYAVQTADEAKTIAEQAAQATIPDGAVTTIKLANGAVTNPKIANDAVTTTKIADGSISAAKIADRNVTLDKLKAGLLVNRNYMDNWFFLGGGSQLGDGIFPINQRGQTNYSNAGYCIDRWWMFAGAIALQNDGLVFSVPSTAQYNGALRQIIESPKSLAGKQVTVTVLVDSLQGGNIVLSMSKGTGINSGLEPAIAGTTFNTTGFLTITGTLPDDIGSSSYPYLIFTISLTKGATAKIRAVKLEVGDKQTLGYTDSNNGNVVTNPPSFMEELMKCQHYLFPVPTSVPLSGAYRAANSESIAVVTPFVMSGNLELSGTVSAISIRSDTAYNSTSIESSSVYAKHGNMVELWVGFTANAYPALYSGDVVFITGTALFIQSVVQ